MTSPIHSFDIDCSRNVSYKFAKLQFNNFLIFQLIFIKFSPFCSKFLTLFGQFSTADCLLKLFFLEKWRGVYLYMPPPPPPPSDIHGHVKKKKKKNAFIFSVIKLFHNTA